MNNFSTARPLFYKKQKHCSSNNDDDDDDNIVTNDSFDCILRRFKLKKSLWHTFASRNV